MSDNKTQATLLLAVALALGVLLGAGTYTFVYAKGFSYMSDEPEVCINCHVMQEHYDAWLNSSHSNVAVCNDCHISQENIVAKYWSKGLNGWNHSVAFTSGNFPEHIHINATNAKITETACRNCHSNIVHAIESDPSSDDQINCTRCHSSVGHGP